MNGITWLFTKLPRPRDIKGNFRPSSQAAACPVLICLPHSVEASHCPIWYVTSSREAVRTNFYAVFGLTRLKIGPLSIVSVADAFLLDH